MTNLYQESINTYLAQVYKTQPVPEKFITISSHHQTIPTTGTFTFPKPQQSDSNSKTQYFVRGISFADLDDNLAPVQEDSHWQTELQVQIICAGQTWVAGQLGLLDLTALKNLIIPIPASDVEQEIELLIQDSTAKKTLKFATLKYDVVVAPDFSGEDLAITRQIIYSVPESGIIHDGRDRLLACPTNRISRIEVYVPENLDVELPFTLNYKPKIYCDDLAIEPSPRTETPHARTSTLDWDCETPHARAHNQVSVANFSDFWGYKTFSFDGTRFAANSLVSLDKQQVPLGKIKYSIIEKQIVRMKNGYIGLAF